MCSAKSLQKVGLTADLYFATQVSFNGVHFVATDFSKIKVKLAQNIDPFRKKPKAFQIAFEKSILIAFSSQKPDTNTSV